MKVRVMPHFGEIVDGVTEIRLNDYEDFDYVIREKLLDHPYMIYRGQRDVTWPLRTTLDRLFFEQHNAFPSQNEADKHLLTFKYATRGRLGQGWTPNDDDSWWSLGQHFGLATPLLDWTESPYVAAYFAFSEPDKQDATKAVDRVVYSLDPVEINKKNMSLQHQKQVKLIQPLLDQNSRLVSQRGCFTKLPLGMDLEYWVRTHFQGQNDSAVLVKIVIPKSTNDREMFLRVLNRKNLNPLTLFPDLFGASLHANNSIFIANY